MKYCHRCGTAVEETHRFCNHCGHGLSVPAPATQQSPPRPAPDHRRHVRLLAVLLLVWGGLGLLGAVGMLVAAGFLGDFILRAANEALPAALVPSLLVVLGWIFVVVSAAAVAAGIGLLDYERWARPLAIAVCVLALFRFPFGTLLGVYGLWVLVSSAGERHFQQMAVART